jgi:hypothetical protein
LKFKYAKEVIYWNRHMRVWSFNDWNRFGITRLNIWNSVQGFFLLIKCNKNYSHYFSPIWNSVWDQFFNAKVCVVRNIKYVFILNFQISNLNLLQFITWLVNHFDNILILLVCFWCSKVFLMKHMYHSQWVPYETIYKW